jgi:hypothetical protein
MGIKNIKYYLAKKLLGISKDSVFGWVEVWPYPDNEGNLDFLLEQLKGDMLKELNARS